MSCHKAWSRDTLVSNFTSKFVTKTYKERREALLNEREKALMPATQPYVELERLIRRKTHEIVQLKLASEKEERALRKIQNIPLAVLAVEHGLANESEAFGVRTRLEADQRKIISSIHIDIMCAQTIQNHMMA